MGPKAVQDLRNNRIVLEQCCASLTQVRSADPHMLNTSATKLDVAAGLRVQLTHCLMWSRRAGSKVRHVENFSSKPSSVRASKHCRSCVPACETRANRVGVGSAEQTANGPVEQPRGWSDERDATRALGLVGRRDLPSCHLVPRGTMDQPCAYRMHAGSACASRQVASSPSFGCQTRRRRWTSRSQGPP